MKHGIFLAAILSTTMLVSAQTMNLTGKVIDSATLAGIPGAAVKLAVSGRSTTTDLNGNWSISTDGVQSSIATSRLNFPSFVAGTELHFPVVENACPVSIVLYDMQGHPVRTLADSRLNRGNYVVQGLTDGLHPQVYLLRVRIGDKTVVHKVPVTRNRSGSAELQACTGSKVSALAKAALLSDTILVSKAGYLPARKPITSYSGNSVIALMKAVQPNFVFFLIDDMPWNGSSVSMDPSVNGSSMTFLHMPALDSLSKKSMIFQNCYAGDPVCSPSRASIQTGKSPGRHNITEPIDRLGYWPLPDTTLTYEDATDATHRVLGPITGLDIQESWTTIGKEMKALGYTTAHFGKWHLNGGGPAHHGYDYSNGNTSNDEGNQDSNLPNDPKRMFSISDSAIKFMDREVKAQRPFYLQISHWADHRGYQCLPKTWTKYCAMSLFDNLDNKNYKMSSSERGLAAMNENLDSALGLVINKIKALGITGNTYIIFNSDNGYRDWNRGIWPLRGAKWWVWDGGLRVPLMISGPGVPAGSRCTQTVSHCDFLPTFLALAGGDPTSLKEIDGTSIVPLLKGSTMPASFQTRPLYFIYPHYRETGAPSAAMITGEEKVACFYDAPKDSNYKINTPYYFNIRQDRLEANDLASANAARANQLKTMMTDYFALVKTHVPIANPKYNPKLGGYKRALAKETIESDNDD